MDVDVVLLGTGLRESILAAALAKAGFSVAHLDHNSYYGADDASLSLDELLQWTQQRTSPKVPSSVYASGQHARFTAISSSASTPSQSRQFSVSLAPTIIPSIGPLVDSLIASGASRYGGFKLLERVAIYDSPGLVKTVPGSKEDVFKSSELSLLEKRRLMRFLLFATAEFETKNELIGKEETPFLAFLRETFSLNDKASEAVAYALAFCTTASDPTLPALQRIRRYLRSAGRYGASPFLVGHYGGVGEIAQGFCRVSAVHGGIYVLGREITSISPSRPGLRTASSTDSSRRRFTFDLHDFQEQFSCDLLISTDDYLEPSLRSQATQVATTAPEPSRPVVRCVAIINSPITFRSNLSSAAHAEPSPESTDAPSSKQDNGSIQVDTALLIFPPSSVEGGSTITAANVLVTGEGSMSTPKDHWILHLSMPLITSTSQSAEKILKPYLDAALTLVTPSHEGSNSEQQSPQPIFTLFYIQHPSPSPPGAPPSSTDSLFIPPSNVSMLSELADSAAANAETTFWKVTETLKELKRSKARGEGEQAEEATIESFWPPINDTSVIDQDW